MTSTDKYLKVKMSIEYQTLSCKVLKYKFQVNLYSNISFDLF